MHTRGQRLVTDKQKGSRLWRPSALAGGGLEIGKQTSKTTAKLQENKTKKLNFCCCCFEKRFEGLKCASVRDWG